MKNIKIGILLGCTLGVVYFYIEVIWRFFFSNQPANPLMVFVGGLCGLFIGFINEVPKFKNMRIWQQSLIGSVIVLIIEFIAGYIINIKFGLQVWDYSGLPLNIMGQISALFALFWFFLMPLAIWLDDWLRTYFFKEKHYYKWYDNYIKLIKGE